MGNFVTESFGGDKSAPPLNEELPGESFILVVAIPITGQDAKLSLPAEIPNLNRSELPMGLLESPSPSPTIEKFNLDDFVSEMVDVVATLSRSQDQVYSGAYLAILGDIQPSVHPV